MSDGTLEPTPEHRFSFGLWTVGHVGNDPFGEPVREPLDPAEIVRRLGDLGAYGVSFHDDDLVPHGASAQEREAILKRFRSALDETGMVVSMATTNLFKHPVFKDGAFTANDPEVRRYAIAKTLRAIDLGAELGAPTYVFWGGREGVEAYAAKDPRAALDRFRESLDFLAGYVRDRGYPMRFALEPKPNEPRGDTFLPTVGHALAFIASLEHGDMVGLNPEVAHETMAGLSFFHGVAQTIWSGKLFHIDLNAQKIGRYDQDLRFGSEDLKEAFFLVKLLEESGYDGPRHFDARPYRVERGQGVWDFAAGCMRTYLLLAQRARQYAQDGEIQEALAEAGAPDLARPTVGPYTPDAAEELKRAAFDPEALGRRGYRNERLDQLVVELLLGARGVNGDGGPVDQRAVRRHNLGLVLRHVAEHGPRSRATIAAATGLNKTTVSSLVGELLDRGLLREAETERPGAVGRPAVTVALEGDGVVALGLEVNVDYLAVGAVDLVGRVRHERVVERDNRAGSPEDAADALAGLVRAALAALGAQGLTPVAMTLGLPGLVDIARGELFVAPNLGWGRVAAADLLAPRVPLPVRVDNEANLAALAAQAELGLHDFLYVSGEVGIGAGIVVGGRLFRGASGFGGEFGHVVVQPGGARCACGNRGCLETVAGQEALLARAGVGAEPPPAGAAAGPGLRRPVAALVARARAGDRRALDALEETGTWLGAGLASAANLVNPAAVVLGGAYAPLADWLAPPVRRVLAERVLASAWSPVEVVASHLGTAAAVRGGARLGLGEVLADPARVGRRERTGVQEPVAT